MSTQNEEFNMLTLLAVVMVICGCVMISTCTYVCVEKMKAEVPK